MLAKQDRGEALLKARGFADLGAEPLRARACAVVRERAEGRPLDEAVLPTDDPDVLDARVGRSSRAGSSSRRRVR